MIQNLNRQFSVLIYRNKNIIFKPLNEDQKIEIQPSEDTGIIDLLEGEVFYNIFMGFEKRKD